jgi:alginate O-acetyltransferase complex protein AlgI
LLFTQYEFFILFFICFVACASVVPKKTRLVILLTSYIFYGWWDWRFISLIIASSLIDFICGLLADKKNISPEKEHQRKYAVYASVIANLGILGFFKYFDFFYHLTKYSLERLGFTIDPLALGIILPVGISFYTFQSLSYTVDVYRGKISSTNNLLDFFVYVSFFPQLVAGPIERSAHLLPQLSKGFSPNLRSFCDGMPLIIWGFFKKLVIADNLAPIVNQIFVAEHPGIFLVLIGGYAFAMQIYCDFSGYSDMARGIARIFKIDLIENFHLPFLARNPREFWRRWHISLSLWFRDYVYISLGGNRLGKKRTYLNLLATLTLCGLWHGAMLNFVAWGLFHGILLVIHREYVTEDLNQNNLFSFKALFHVIGFFHINLLGWILFRSSSHNHSFIWLCQSLIHYPNGGYFELLSSELFTLVISYIFILSIQIYQAKKDDMTPWESWPGGVRIMWYVFLVISIIHLQPVKSDAFIYFQF